MKAKCPHCGYKEGDLNGLIDERNIWRSVFTGEL